MALLIHTPHLPHLDEWSLKRMILISGLVAVGIAAGTVIVVQQLDDTTTSSATQASPSELDDVSGSGALAVSPDLLVGDDLMALYGTDNPAYNPTFVGAGSSAPIAAPTKQALAPPVKDG